MILCGKKYWSWCWNQPSFWLELVPFWLTWHILFLYFTYLTWLFLWEWKGQRQISFFQYLVSSTATYYLFFHLICDLFMFTYQQWQILLANLAVAGYRTGVVSVLWWSSIPIFSWVESPYFLCHFVILTNCMLLSFLRMDFSPVFVPLKPLFL